MMFMWMSRVVITIIILTFGIAFAIVKYMAMLHIKNERFGMIWQLMPEMINITHIRESGE